MPTALLRRVIATAVCCASPVSLLAQVGYLWTPEELTAKADVVAIVQVSSTRDTGRRQSHPELQPRLPVVEMDAELVVLAWLKPVGPPEAMPRLRLTYFRRDVAQWHRENPSPPGAPPRGLMNAGSSLQLEPGPTRYLVFLSRRRDGRYEPLSGQTFPATSVLRLCESGQRPAGGTGAVAQGLCG